MNVKAFKESITVYYNSDILTDVSADIDGTGTIIKLPHTRNAICGLQNSVDVSKDGTVPLNGSTVPVELALSLIQLGKEINVDLYIHLWDKYAEIEACTTDEEVALVVWAYDIEQVYTLS